MSTRATRGARKTRRRKMRTSACVVSCGGGCGARVLTCASISLCCTSTRWKSRTALARSASSVDIAAGHQRQAAALGHGDLRTQKLPCLFSVCAARVRTIKLLKRHTACVAQRLARSCPQDSCPGQRARLRSRTVSVRAACANGRARRTHRVAKEHSSQDFPGALSSCAAPQISSNPPSRKCLKLTVKIGLL